MKKLVVANLKMNLGLEAAQKYITTIKGQITNQLLVIICPSFPFLSLFKSAEYQLGSQNTFYKKDGNYTGEVSPSQLKSLGVKYIIVGHSERRLIFHETNKIINQKVAAVLKENLYPILCVGENKEQKLLHKTPVVIKEQLNEALKKIDQEMLNDVIIAYEPIWAIGTGLTPTPGEINSMGEFIKRVMSFEYNANNTRVLYGGSINQNNIKSIFSLENIDGVLIGGAAVNPDLFIETLNKIS